MSSARLPPRPNLIHLRRQAKKLLHAHQNGEEEALLRVREYLPLQRTRTLGSRDRVQFGLRDAMLVVAREYGFASWPKLKAFVTNGGNARDEESTMTTIELNEALFGCCENHNLDRMRELIDKGAEPKDAVNEGWDCDVLYGCLQTYARREPERFHACINTLIDAGAPFEDGVLWDLWRGRSMQFERRLTAEPALLQAKFELDCGGHLTLRGATLLHVAVEFNLGWAVDILLDHGADLDARAGIGRNGVGGQTPLFHSIGSNQGSCYALFEYLLEKGPDLTVRATIQDNPEHHGQVMDCIHKGQDHTFERVLELTPLGYALRYEHEPDWRSASREVKRLREMGAPEA